MRCHWRTMNHSLINHSPDSVMTDKTSNHFAIEWSEDICDAIMQQADDDAIEPEVAVYAALAAAVVLGRSVGMDDAALREQFEQMVTVEFPEAMLKDG